jgi:predicted transcriptional regulator
MPTGKDVSSGLKPPSEATIDRIRKKLAERHRQNAGEQRLVPPNPSPRYDEVFWEGTRWLDSLAEEDFWDDPVDQLQELQIQQIHSGLREADAGDFASDDEMAAVLAKWKRRAELSDSQQP